MARPRRIVEICQRLRGIKLDFSVLRFQAFVQHIDAGLTDRLQPQGRGGGSKRVEEAAVPNVPAEQSAAPES